MLRRIALRDFVIVPALELELQAGFTALTGETGAGKSILIDALQLALGQRGDAGVVREGAARAEITAEFDTPPALRPWLAEAGFNADDDDTLLLRRSLDAQGKSRAWVNGSAATATQLRELGEKLVDIHGQHAWQSLTRPDAVRALLDGYAGVDSAPLAAAWAAWRGASERLADARARQGDLDRERERLQWQLNELDKLAPADGEWPELEAEHRRLSHAQAILDALQAALAAISDDEASADARSAQAIDAIESVLDHDASLREPLDVIRSAQAQLQDAAHTLNAALRHADLDPDRLQQLDDRLGAWMGLARRFRRPAEELPVLRAEWKAELAQLDAATDLDALERTLAAARRSYDAAAKAVSAQRATAAPRLAAAITAAMQQLGMAGGRFDVALEPLAEPQRHGRESAEFRVAAHPGSTPRALAKVASGGELSRIALAIAVTTSELGETGTLIFDEIDAGVGGTVADAVGQLMKRLGRDRQVLCVTHLPQVAACADRHCVVSKSARDGRTTSDVQPVQGEARVQEIARMLGGSAASTSLAHAQALLSGAAVPDTKTRKQRA
ncbi:DNA repair protein RecN [uncultured Methylibium sp.]|uniref:DNA repair protein RecN n=1 Tax=uncultured Methylibium sp. TaxID=381093 RepID=UPI0025F8F119|nr:DNA repair protein RecN [uncultured Methylibium sp.]